jgi:hypothetical protein
LYPASITFIRVLESRRMRLKGHKAKAWKRWKAETKYSTEWIPPGEIGVDGNVSIRETGQENANWSDMTQDKKQRWVLMNAVTNRRDPSKATNF